MILLPLKSVNMCLKKNYKVINQLLLRMVSNDLGTAPATTDIL